MLHSLRTVCILSLAFILPVNAQSIEEHVNSITAENLKKDLSVLAHDSLQGRDTGAEGLKKAARFLANEYQKLGLATLGDNGSFFQHFDLNQNVVKAYHFSVKRGDGNEIDNSVLNKEKRSSFVSLSGSGNATGQIAYTGAGLSDSTVSHLDIDLSKKWALLFYERGVSNIGALREKMDAEGSAGALLIMKEDQNPFAENVTQAQEAIGVPGRMSLAYLTDNSVPSSSLFLRIKPELAAKLLGLSSTEELEAMRTAAFEKPLAVKPNVLDYTLDFRSESETITIQSKNVLALLEGSDPNLKDEVVVLSSHYDHVGIGRPDSTGDTIYNGADDDGSGTVGVLHAAKAFVAAKKAGHGPKRSVLFLHVAGEEKGLLGSRYYSDHPVLPIEKTIANVNVDMIGRIDPAMADSGDYIYIIGGSIISSGLAEMVEQANKKSVNISLSQRYNDLNDPNQFYRRSDHWNFGRLGVPFVFFFNGVHPDYHRPSDEIDKIDFDALTKRTKLLYMSAVGIANAEQAPVVDNQAFIEKTKVNPR